MQIVVIGGGIIGLTTAYHLAREGAQVTVLDARATGLGASDVNAGWVVPAEAAPVPGPGVVLTSLKWMLSPDSPLYIRPSLHPQFLSFMFGLWRASNARDQRAGFAAHLELTEGTIESFDDYRADGMEFEMHSQGLLMAFLRRENLDHHLTHLDLVRRYGLEPTLLVGDDVRVHEPHLSDAVQGGLFFPRERHVDPRALAAALRGRLLEMGVGCRMAFPFVDDGERYAGHRRRSFRLSRVSQSRRPAGSDRFLDRGQAQPLRTTRSSLRTALKPRKPAISRGFRCGPEGTRTPDPLHAMQVRYQLRHRPRIASLLLEAT